MFLLAFSFCWLNDLWSTMVYMRGKSGVQVGIVACRARARQTLPTRWADPNFELASSLAPYNHPHNIWKPRPCYRLVQHIV